MMLKQIVVGSGPQKIDASPLPAGIYFWQTVLEDGRPCSGKMSVIK